MTNLRNQVGGLDSAVRIGKALDHPLRVRALAALRQRELCVCELIELFGLAPSTVSKHMSIICEAGLINRRKEGRWTYYSLPHDPEKSVEHALAMVSSLVDDDQTVGEDRNRVPTIHCATEDPVG